jgi:predicted protein tyrosine phosphatase
MWTWTLNWNEIRDDIVIGSCPLKTADIDRISEQTGATALLSVQHDECRDHFGIDYEQHRRHGERAGLAMVNAPMRDFDPPEQRERLPVAVFYLHKLITGGRKVYVHCTAGVNRSPLTVLGYLTFVEGMSSDDAMALIRRGRPEAEPTWEAYHGCRQDLLDRHRIAIQAHAWELSQDNQESDSENTWYRAEAEIIREVCTRPPPPPVDRLDPHRS